MTVTAVNACAVCLSFMVGYLLEACPYVYLRFAAPIPQTNEKPLEVGSVRDEWDKECTGYFYSKYKAVAGEGGFA